MGDHRDSPQPWTLYRWGSTHGLQTPREEIAFTARPKIQSQSQIFRYGIFCLPHWPNFSDTYLWFMPSLGVRSPCVLWFTLRWQLCKYEWIDNVNKVKWPMIIYSILNLHNLTQTSPQYTWPKPLWSSLYDVLYKFLYFQKLQILSGLRGKNKIKIFSWFSFIKLK